MSKKLLVGATVMAIVALIAAACGGGGGGESTPEVPAPTPTPTPVVEEPAPVAEAPAEESFAFQSGLPEFDQAAAFWNSYWYGRYNLGSLTMMSALGITFTPDMAMAEQMMKTVDQGPLEGEHVPEVKNPALVMAVFAGGDPSLANVNNGDPWDLANGRWDPSKMDTRLTPGAQAQTILKEVEWAKFFNGGWAGAPTDDFGAFDRFKGLVLFMEAKMQVDFALKNLRADNGLFVAASRWSDDGMSIVDGRTLPLDQHTMLMAMADVLSVLNNPQQWHGLYADEATRATLEVAIDDFFVKVTELQPATIEELSWAIRSLAWYASITQDAALKQKATELIGQYGDRLLALEGPSVVDKAIAIRGLVEVHRLSGSSSSSQYLLKAAEAFKEIANDYEPATGSFRSQGKLTAHEIGDFLSAFNALRNWAGDAVDQGQVQEIFLGFFESAINLSGLQLSAPPKEMEAAPFELQRMVKDIYLAYPTIPTPDRAGGEKGIAPVFASEATFDPASGRWVVSDNYFDTEGAMYLSNELLWESGLANGFPTVE